ncbi:MAG: hypothetical protein V5A38_08455 [Halolamina sp.]|uniref:hypothetical protein n=1 Tax=Halolamina sp. TaxID=1940283 RepID=UPI002FC28B5E
MVRLPGRLARWFSIEQPVSYWTFWWALLRVVPLLLGVFALVTIASGMQFRLDSLAPLPFVFICATFGFAVRDLDEEGGLISLLLATFYSVILWLTGTGSVLLREPTPMLSVFAALAVVAMFTGFASPTLHGRQENEQFARVYQDRLDDD